MNFGQGHGLAVWRPSLELSFLTQHFNQVQSHFLIYTTLIYPAKGYHVLFLAHPSCENIMPLHNTLPRYSIEPCHLFSVDAFQPRLPYNWQSTCAKFHFAEWWEACWKNFSPTESAKAWCYERSDALCPNVCPFSNVLLNSDALCNVQLLAITRAES